MDIALAHQVAVDAAEDAGALLRRGVAEGIAGFAKGNRGDVWTSLEPVLERCIVDRIRRDFPSHRIIAEEAGVLEGTDDSHVWVVDPLDGTNNAVLGLHDYVVGIALCERGVPVVGVVCDPIAGQTWHAVRDQGLLGPTATDRPAACGLMVAWTQGHEVDRDDPAARSLLLVLESRAHRVLPLWAPL